MTTSVSSTAGRVPDAAAGDVILAAAATAARKGTATLAKTVIDAVATSAANELGKAIVGAPKKATSTKKTSGTKKPSSGTKKPTGTKPAPKPSPSRAKGEFAFLDDPNMSIEEKLFRFMALVSKKNDEDLIEKMKEFETKKDSGGLLGGLKGGLWGALKAAVPGLGGLEAVFGSDVLKQLGGPALAAAVTALGMPQLAPIAMKLGPELMEIGAGVIDALEATPVSSGSGSTSLRNAGTRTLGAQSDGKEGLSKEEAMEIEFM
ncbi:MAG TPA: hypothetical protein VD838_04850, partial [Anaeromyxobacteraceae bacterium]|nr:hypothetical protein [Anaeromyxobacteraceae bacterium]